MKKEKIFKKPEAEIIEFNIDDIILTSNLGGTIDTSVPDLDD